MFQCFHNQHKKIVVQLKLSPFSLQVACVKHVRNRAWQTSSLLWRVCFHMYLFSFTPCNEKGFKWRHLPSTAGVLIAIVWCLWVSYDALWTNTVMMNMCSKKMRLWNHTGGKLMLHTQRLAYCIGCDLKTKLSWIKLQSLFLDYEWNK